MTEEQDIGHFGRVLTGCVGGVLVVVNKIVSQGASGIRFILDDLGRSADAMNQIFGYGTVALAAIIVSAVVAWSVTEKSRLKLLMIAVSAPALVTAWSGAPGGARPESLAFVAPAFAQEAGPPSVPSEGFWKGVYLFFSGAPEVTKYRVVVASALTPDAAALIANKLSQEAPFLQAAVADRAPGNPYFAVVASGFLPYAQASAILAEVKKISLGSHAYLSAEKANSSGIIH